MRRSRGAPAAYISLIYYPGIWLSGTPGRRSAAGTLSNTNHSSQFWRSVFGIEERSYRTRLTC